MYAMRLLCEPGCTIPFLIVFFFDGGIYERQPRRCYGTNTRELYSSGSPLVAYIDPRDSSFPCGRSLGGDGEGAVERRDLVPDIKLINQQAAEGSSPLLVMRRGTEIIASPHRSSLFRCSYPAPLLFGPTALYVYSTIHLHVPTFNSTRGENFAHYEHPTQPIDIPLPMHQIATATAHSTLFPSAALLGRRTATSIPSWPARLHSSRGALLLCSSACSAVRHQSTAAPSGAPPSASPPTAQDQPTRPMGAEQRREDPAAGPTRTQEWRFRYRPRWRYASPFRSSSVLDYVCSRGRNHIASIAHTYRHPLHGLTVTLIPLRHMAHPSFFSQVDALCSQHQSVLMEGRTPLAGAPYSTLVPPREPIPANQRPVDHEDDEGWEPRALEDFFQPFSWGVLHSPEFTVIHAADKYDYECLPWYCSVRFNAPLIGSLAREQHCLDMIPHLHRSGYKSFAIPWGAAHMPIFHEMLLDNGFEPVGMCSLLMFSRIDGDRSEGEVMRLQSYEKRVRRRGYIGYALAAVLVLYVLATMFEVELSGAPSSKRLESRMLTPTSPGSES
eukprot:gene1824-1110_t